MECNGHEATWRADNTCSYCGGLNPEELLKGVSEGTVTLTPTDKSYKVYVEPGMRKCYFYHFSLEQKHKFVNLYNDGTMKIGVPGDFYVFPYFMAKEPVSG